MNDDLVQSLIEAALDQRKPSVRLVLALQALLKDTRHPMRLLDYPMIRGVDDGL